MVKLKVKRVSRCRSIWLIGLFLLASFSMLIALWGFDSYHGFDTERHGMFRSYEAYLEFYDWVDTRVKIGKGFQAFSLFLWTILVVSLARFSRGRRIALGSAMVQTGCVRCGEKFEWREFRNEAWKAGVPDADPPVCSRCQGTAS